MPLSTKKRCSNSTESNNKTNEDRQSTSHTFPASLTAGGSRPPTPPTTSSVGSNPSTRSVKARSPPQVSPPPPRLKRPTNSSAPWPTVTYPNSPPLLEIGTLHKKKNSSPPTTNSQRPIKSTWPPSPFKKTPPSRPTSAAKPSPTFSPFPKTASFSPGGERPMARRSTWFPKMLSISWRLIPPRPPAGSPAYPKDQSA